MSRSFGIPKVDEKIIENMRYAMNELTARYERKPLFACLFCGGAAPCENLKSAGVDALCLSWAQNGEKPKLSKIIAVLDSLISRSETLTNAVVVCSELETSQLSSNSA